MTGYPESVAFRVSIRTGEWTPLGQDFNPQPFLFAVTSEVVKQNELRQHYSELGGRLNAAVNEPHHTHPGRLCLWPFIKQRLGLPPVHQVLTTTRVLSGFI